MLVYIGLRVGFGCQMFVRVGLSVDFLVDCVPIMFAKANTLKVSFGEQFMEVAVKLFVRWKFQVSPA